MEPVPHAHAAGSHADSHHGAESLRPQMVASSEARDNPQELVGARQMVASSVAQRPVPTEETVGETARSQMHTSWPPPRISGVIHTRIHRDRASITSDKRTIPLPEVNRKIMQ